MPNQPRASNGNRTLRFEDDLWAEFKEACADLGISRNQRLIEHAQADIERWRMRYDPK